MAKYKGRDLFVKVNGVAVACATTCEIDVNGEAIEVSSPTSGTDRTYIPGRKGWKITCNEILTTDEFDDAIDMVNTTVEVSYCYGAAGTNDASPTSGRTVTKERKGSAICTRWTSSAKNGDWATGAFEFLGSGPLTKIK